MTSLFIGNLARDIDKRHLEDEFQKISPCTFRFKVVIGENKNE
jgi:RNA recognition motif-containing protein